MSNSAIKRDLPNNQYQAAINANNPNGVNTFATLADIVGGSGGNQIISGAASYSGVGLTYDVSVLVYTIQGTLYSTAAPTQVTLAAADPTFDRIDVIYVDDTQTVGVITGVPSASPVKPQVDNLTQVEVTFVTVPAGAVSPGVTIEEIYEENAGTPTEWAGTATAPVIFNSTVAPYAGTYCIETTANFGSNKNITFTPAAPYTMAGGILTFWLKAKNNMSVSTGKFLVGFYVGGSLVGNSITIGGTPSSTFGFIGSVIGTWQLVSIPISAFGGLPANIDDLRFFTLAGSNTAQFYADRVRILEGVPTPPAPIAGHEIQDEGVALIQRPILDFQGAGVTATDDALNGKTIVTIPGGGATNLTVDSTGVLTGGVLSIGAPNTTFSISDGTGQIVTTAGVKTPVSWSGKTNIPVTNIATQLITFVAIDSGGNVIQSTTRFTAIQARTLIVLGVVVHVNLTNVDAVNNEQHIAFNAMSSVYDGFESLGFFNVSGNVYSANGANLTMNKSAGVMFKMGSNYDVTNQNPHQRTLGALAPVTFQYRFSNGDNGVTGTNVDPNNLDNGAGGLTAVGTNKWSVQRIYSFTSNNVKVQRGVADYTTKELALSAISTEAYTTEPSIAANGLLRGWLIVKQGATALNDPNQATFLAAGKLGESATGGGASTAIDLQTAYNNSIANPEILTNATNGPISVRQGSGADNDFVYEGKNGLGATTFSVEAGGAIIGANLKKANFFAITNPSTTNDITQGYAVGSIWLNTSTDIAYVCLDSTASNAVWRQYGHTIEDEGTPVTQRNNMNFTGAGVSVSDIGGKTVVTIPGGGAGSVKYFRNLWMYNVVGAVGYTWNGTSISAPTAAITSTAHPHRLFNFSGTNNQHQGIYFEQQLPSFYTAGANIRVTLNVTALTATGGAVFYAGLTQPTAGNVLGGTTETEWIAQTATFTGVTGYHVVQLTFNFTGTNMSPGDSLLFRVYRDPNDAGDNLGTVGIVSIAIEEL